MQAAQAADDSHNKIYNMHKIIMMALAGTFGGLSCGYNSGVVAPAMLYMDENYPGITAVAKAVRFIELTKL